MTPEQFGRVERLFFQAAELPPAERSAFLDRACDGPGDEVVRAEVEGLLGQHGSGGRVATEVLARPVDRAVGHLVSADSSERALQLVGTTIGAYQITGVLAGGGMGVVYAGRDTRLGRAVAVKAVMPAFTGDPVWLARFHREARILASLSHPNVATVFGLEEKDDRRFLVMEMLEGTTLAQRLGRGVALSIPEALQVCAHVAAGVQAAHEEGVVHRDLKPANVMLLPDGRVKVLDFGLAREVEAGGDDNAATAATLPIHGVSGQGNQTRHGAVIGTPGYMSPEQVRGMPVDRRTDVFAFGCILYECLAGRVAFPGSSGADIIVGILERDPDWSLLPPRTPDSVRRLLRRCCMKDASQRLRDMADVRLALEDALYERDWLGDAAAAPPARSAARRRRLLMAAPWVLLAATLAGAAALWQRTRTADAHRDADAAAAAAAARPAAKRFAVAFPNNHPQADLSHVRVGLSRDGAQMVVSASDGREQHLWHLAPGETALRRIEGTLDAWLPSFSPDGDEILYFDAGVMRRRRLGGGNASKVVDVAGFWGDYDWGADGMVSYVPYWTDGVARVGVAGGTPQFVTAPDYAAGEAAHVGPVATRDGRAVLYTVWDGKNGTRVDAVDLATRTPHNVVRDGLTPRLARVGGGGGGTYLLWSRAGTIYAAPFDERTLKLTGPETPLVDGVMTDEATFNACFDAADDGTLAYVPGPSFTEESRLGWLDVGEESPPPPGRSTRPMNDDRLSFVHPRFTADGKRLSVIVKGDVYRPYVYDLERESFERVVIGGDDASSAISPDGRSLAYSTNKEGKYRLWLRDLGTGHDRAVHDATAEYHAGVTWSRDGRYLAFAMPPDTHSRRDVWVLDLTRQGGDARAFCDGPADQRAAEFAPGGNWVAYVSDESGRREVYVRSFPDGQRSLQLSAEGGDWPQWSPAGDRVYYRDRGKLYSVGFSPTDGTADRRPKLEYDRRFGQSDFDLPDYAVAPDGRLLLVEPSERAPTAPQINVLLNWPSLIKPAPK